MPDPRNPRWAASMKTSRTAPLRVLPCFALLLLATQGCVLSQSTKGTSISDQQVAAIVPGTSTRADVVRILGAPDDLEYSNREHDPLFERMYVYDRTKRKTTYFSLILFSAARSDENRDRVVIFFDDEGVVEDVGYRLDMDRPRYGMPWGDE